MMALWSSWTAHDGEGCPLSAGVWVEVVGVVPSGRVAGYEGPCDPDDGAWTWSNFGKPGVGPDGRRGLGGKILRYRTRRYPAADRVMAAALTAAEVQRKRKPASVGGAA